MATHDYVIDNATGANVRADINLVLQAILTNNSSSSAPSTTAAYMWWADTTNGVLKIRNSSDNGWVDLFQLDGTITLEDGTASAPALANRGDLDTGVFFSADNTFNVATGGVERMELGATTIFNESGADVDFRIEGDSEANLFYVDAGNDRIGVNENAPIAKFHIKNADTSATSVSSNANELVIEDTGNCGMTIQSANDGVGNIYFGDVANGSVGRVTYNHTSNFMSFQTNASDAMRIDSSARLLIGTTTTTGGTEPLHVVEDGVGGRIVLARNDTTVSSGATLGTIRALGNDSDGSFQEVAKIDFVADKNHGTNDKAGRIVFSTTADNASSPTERLYIRNDGELRVLGGNINLMQQSNALNTQNGQIGGGNTQQGFNSRITFNTAGAVNHGNITFHTMSGGTDNEIFRINKDQQFLFQATSSGQVGIMMFRNSTSPYPRIMHGGSGSSFANHTLIEFRSTVDGVIGEIKQDGDGTITYATSSDYRLKENIVDLTGAITRLKNLKPKRFNFKKNSSITKDGFLAHELQEVIPEAVNGTKDEVVTEDSKTNIPQLAEEEVGNPVYQTADLARVVPLLTAALQEAITKIETLETKVAALEAA